jgi:hypothetical protein
VSLSYHWTIVDKSKKHNVATQRISAQFKKLSRIEMQKSKNFINRVLSVFSSLGRVNYIKSDLKRITAFKIALAMIF